MNNGRKIIHVDADSFFASVELRHRPELASSPVAIGGSADRRGVIATCNYEARKFGVRSAMATAHALRLCPNLVMIPPNFKLYKEVSAEIVDIFHEFTDLIEPLSLDEAYLDVSEVDLCRGSATRMAEEIRRRIHKQLNLTVSAGVAPCKFLAKVASDWRKPDGLTVVTPNEVDDFVYHLPVAKISGVGKVTANKLRGLGIETCGQLQEWPLQTLIEHFGVFGQRLYQMARGIDPREVRTSRVRKSISVETTFAADLIDDAELAVVLSQLLDELEQRFSRLKDRYQPDKRLIKIKFSDFSQTTMALKFSSGEWRDLSAFGDLLGSVRARSSLPVRLLGIGLGLLPPTQGDFQEQLCLF